MNWLKNIRRILGRFWSFVFRDHDFTDGVASAASLFGRYAERMHDDYASSLINADVNRSFEYVSYPVYIDRKDATGTHPVSTCEGILNGAEIGLQDPDAGFITGSLYQIPAPRFLTDHVLDSTAVLVSDFDYSYRDSEFLFHTDLSAMELPVVTLTGPDGLPREYYRLFGWQDAGKLNKDSISGFYSPVLSPYADIVWDMHQNGASVHSVKKLLGAVTDSVICDRDGAVDHYWTEQNMQYVLAGDLLYRAPLSVPFNFRHGDSVTTGDILFGSMLYYEGGAVPDPSVCPGMVVRTDAGTLTADNADRLSYNVSGVTVVPLTGDRAVLEQYKRICAELAEDRNCPSIPVPSSMNPFSFIINTVRRGRGCFISVKAGMLSALAAALDCIRRTANAAGIVTVYVRAATEPATVSVTEFSATCGSGSVAAGNSVKIKEACSEARILL